VESATRTHHGCCSRSRSLTVRVPGFNCDVPIQSDQPQLPSPRDLAPKVPPRHFTPKVPLLPLTRRSALRRSAPSRAPRRNSKGNQKTRAGLTHFLALPLGALPRLRSSHQIFHPRLLVRAPVDILFPQTCSGSSSVPLCRASCGACATPHSPVLKQSTPTSKS
jgi:hypothetical protein